MWIQIVYIFRIYCKSKTATIGFLEQNYKILPSGSYLQEPLEIIKEPQKWSIPTRIDLRRAYIMWIHISSVAPLYHNWGSRTGTVEGPAPHYHSWRTCTWSSQLKDLQKDLHLIKSQLKDLHLIITVEGPAPHHHSLRRAYLMWIQIVHIFRICSNLL